MKSLNNRLILEPYTGDRKVKTKVSSGFAMVQQKSTLVGLKVLVDSEIVLGGVKTEIKKGQKAYFLEDTLYTQKWSKSTFTCDALKEEFIVAMSSEVVFVA